MPAIVLNALYGIPAWLVVPLVCGSSVSLVCAGQVWVHRRFRNHDFTRHNDVTGFLVTVVGALFAVMLAFVTFIVWQEFDGSKERVSVEAADAAIGWHMAKAVPPPLGPALRAQMAYAHVMLTDDWPLMRSGGVGGRGETILTAAISAVVRHWPAESGASNAQAALLARLTDLHDARRHRYQDNASGISGFQWTVIVVGAIAVLCFCYLFGLQDSRIHLLMTAAVRLTISSMFVLIFEMDYPFRGDVAVSPEPWTTLVQRFTQP